MFTPPPRFYVRFVHAVVIIGLMLGAAGPAARARTTPTAIAIASLTEQREAWAGAQEQAARAGGAEAQAQIAMGMADVSLALEAPTDKVRPGAVAPVRLVVKNDSAVDAEGLWVTMHFNAGLAEVVGDAGQQMMRPGELRWEGVKIAAGARWEQVVALRISQQFSADVTLVASVQGDDLYTSRHAQQVVWTMDPPPVTVRVTPDEAQTLSALGGRIVLEIPVGAVAEPVVVRLQWSRPRADDPDFVQERFELTALNDKGDGVTQFAVPLRLRVRRDAAVEGVRMDERAFAESVSGMPGFFWLDEEKGEWVPVEGTYDAASTEVMANIAHFSTWAQGEANSFGDLGLPQLKVDAASLFAGDFSFSYPLAAPAGPHGFGPRLSLSYSDEVANSAWDADRQGGNVGDVYRTQAAEVGYGWNIGGLGKISIDWHASPVKAYLSFGGGSFELKWVNTAWHTEPEGFLQIWRDVPAGESESGDFLKIWNWHILDQDGMEYVFGNGMNAGTAYMRRALAECDYAAYAYYLTRVEDVFGNHWDVAYAQETEWITRDQCTNATYIRATYPQQVSLYRQGSSTEIARIEFVTQTGTRSDTDIKDRHAVPQKQALWAYKLIGQIRVYSRGASDLQEIYRYDLAYHPSHGTDHNCDSNTRTCTQALLDSITVSPQYDPGGGTGPSRTVTFGYWTHSGANFNWVDINFSAIYLQTIANGHGGDLFLYREAHDYYQQPGGTEALIHGHYRQRLLGARVNDGLGRFTWSTFQYSGGQYDTQGTGWPDGDDEFAGFATVESHLHEQTSSNSTTPPSHTSTVVAKTNYSFLQGMGSWPDDVLRGRLWRSDRYQGVNDPVIYARTVHTFVAEDLNGLGWAKLDKTLWHVDMNQTSWDKRCTTYGYDTTLQGGQQYGRVTHVRERPDWCDSTPYRTTVTQYAANVNLAANPAIYMIRPSETKVYAGDAGSGCSAQTRYYYDGLSWGSVSRQGLLTKKSVQSNSCDSGSNWLDTEYTYWSNGNAKRTTLPPSANDYRGWQEITWDGIHGAYAVTVATNRGNDIVNSYATITSYDYALGVALSVTDPNGVANEFEYDGYGRLRRSWIEPQNKLSGDTRHTTKVEYYEGTTTTNAACSSSWCVLSQQLDEAGGDNYLTSYTFLDGLGRTIQSQSEGESQHIVADTWYHANGQAEKQSVPYFSSAAFGNYHDPASQPFTQHGYDGLGRVTTTTAPDTSVTATYYQGYKTAVIDALGRMTLQEQDDWGRLAFARQYTGTYASPNWSAAAYATSSYQYDVLDRLTGVTGPGGATEQTTITYDLAGRKIGMSDPDMGFWSYEYDNLGNVTRQTDAKGQTLCFEYDMLNRKTYTRDTSGQDCSDGLNWRATYTYDQGTNGIGRRTGMSDGAGGSTSWVYDVRGRVTKETKVIGGTGGGTFMTQWSYDAADRVSVLTYPGGKGGQAGEQVKHVYNTRGLLEQLYRQSPTPTYTYVDKTDYNALGQPIDRWLGGGGVVRQHYDYTAAENYRLTGLRSGVSPNYNTLQNLTYTYDDAGNVLSITDAAAVGGSQTQSFSYDALNRLLTAQASGSATYGGYSQVNYGYSNAGNITSFEGTAFTYQDSAHKHAVTHLAGAQKYWYDANGNATRRINFGLDVNYAYDAENRLIGVSGGKTAAFTYDGDGRLVKTQVDSTYVAIAGAHYQYSGSTGTKHYYAGNVRVAERVGGTLYWLLSDHLGSTAVTTNASGGNVAELRYYAYGKPRYNVGGQKTDYRFTGQRWQNDLGIYWYNSRWYDQLTGRFLQPDTIVPNPGNPGSLNRYSYVLNNPLRYTDPSGHRVSDGCEYEGCDLRNGLPSSSTYFVPRVGYTMYPQTVEPLVSPVVQQAASELLAAIDPRNLPELRYDDAGNIDWDATISTLSMFPALHACALTVQGACAVGIQNSGYMPGMGGRNSWDVWMTTSGEIVVTGSGGGGAYVSPNLVGGAAGIGVTVLPHAQAQDLNDWAVQVGGSVVIVGGVTAEFVFLRADSGSTIVGVSTSYGAGGGIEGHVSFTYAGYLYQGRYVPR